MAVVKEKTCSIHNIMRIRALQTDHQALLEAAATGNWKALTLANFVLIRESRCVSGCTALHWAAGSNQVDVVRYLVTMVGMDVNVAVASNKKAAGRTPLHYAARNGFLEAATCLVEEFGANCNALAKHRVTPFQFAMFQNQLRIATWLVNTCKVNVFDTNDYGCNALHWLAICPALRAGENGIDLIPTAEWLLTVQNTQHQLSPNDQVIDLLTATQKQGHNVLHKAAWLGHIELIRYLHEKHDLWDDSADDAGNYAAVLAEMGGHIATGEYLRRCCSHSAERSCTVLGISIREAKDPSKVRQAYLTKAKHLHPDRLPYDITKVSATEAADAFNAIRKAYHHLTIEQGRGQQHNPAHSLKLMLQVSNICNDTISSASNSDDNLQQRDCFKARLIAVLMEYGDLGVEVSNLKKKWRQVWRTDFPLYHKRKISLRQWIRQHADDVIEFRVDDKGCDRVHAKHCTRDILAAAVAASS